LSWSEFDALWWSEPDALRRSKSTAVHRSESAALHRSESDALWRSDARPNLCAAGPTSGARAKAFATAWVQWAGPAEGCHGAVFCVARLRAADTHSTHARRAADNAG